MFSFRKPVFRIFLVTIIFLGHEASVNGFGMNLIEVPDDDVSQVICSMALLRKYYNAVEPLSGSVLYMSLTRASMHTQKKLLEAIHAMTDYPWSIVIRDPKSAKTLGSSNAVLHEKPQCYFVIIENLEDEDLEDVFEDWKITVNWNPLAQFVVYLSSIEETDEEMTELMVEILLSFMNKKIYNVNVIGQNEENGFYYGKTVFPYHPDNNCGNRVISIETLDVCDYHLGERTMDDDNENDDDTNSLEKNDNDNDDGDGDGESEGEGKGEGQGGDYENNNNKNDNDEDDGDDQGANHDENNENNSKNHDDGNEGTDQNYDGNSNEVTDGNGQSEENSLENDKNDDEKKSNDDDNQENQTENGSNHNNHDEDGQDDKKFTNNDNIPQESSSGEERSSDVEDNKTESNDHYDDNIIEDTFDEEPGMENSNVEIHSYESETTTVDVDNPEDYSVKDASIFEGNDKKHNIINHKMTENGSARRLKKSKPEKTKKKKMKSEIKSRKKGRMAPTELRSHFSGSHSSFANPKKKRKRRSTGRYYDMNPIKENPYKLPKFMRLEKELNEDDMENNTSTQTDDEPHFYFEEIFRALFLDKFPKDLSGCPLPAAYRPWEPYIFTERADITHDYSEEKNTERNNETSLPSYNEYENDGATNGDYNDNGSDSQLFQFDGLNEYDNDEAIASEDSREKTLSGIEYQLLLTIGERLHMNIDLQVENTNLYHLFQELIDGDIELVIGGIDEDPSMSQFVSTTIPYHQDDLTWCVAKARRSYSLFNFLASFSLVVWLISLVYIFVAALTIVWMQHVYKERLKNLNYFLCILVRIFCNIINQSMPIVIKREPLRLAFASTFFFSLIFINAYQSFLISTLTTPQSAYQIKRIEEIYQNGMTIKGSVDNVRHLNKEGEIFRYIREKFQMCYNIEECLMEAAENENVAVAVSRQHSFYNPRIPRNRLYCFDRNENIYVYLVTMLLPKKFHLLHKINPVIQHVIESGHMQKWARDLDMRRRILEERNRASDDKFRSLTIGQVVGTFVFAGALLGVASMVLTLECCVYRLATNRRRRRWKIVKFLHRRFLRA